MRLNIPKTATISHELPIFTQLSREFDLPVSEVKARFNNELIEKFKEAMDDPSMQKLGDNEQDLVHAAVDSLRLKLAHPEEQTSDTEEFNKLMGFDPSEPPPEAANFSAPDEFGGEGGLGGGFGGGLGGGFSSGIDNMDLGFSDEGMASFDQVSDDLSDFGSEATGDGVNAMSEIEPGGSNETETEPLDLGGSNESSGKDNDLGGNDDLAEL